MKVHVPTMSVLVRVCDRQFEQFAFSGNYFKQSSRKNDRTLEFAPLNLHLQRMWVHNDTLNKSGFYDFISVGAFTAHSHKSKNGGLIRYIHRYKIG